MYSGTMTSLETSSAKLWPSFVSVQKIRGFFLPLRNTPTETTEYTYEQFLNTVTEKDYGF